MIINRTDTLNEDKNSKASNICQLNVSYNTLSTVPCSKQKSQKWHQQQVATTSQNKTPRHDTGSTNKRKITSGIQLKDQQCIRAPIRRSANEEGDVPRFLQLYIYDTNNEVQNRMAHFGGEEQSGLKREIVEGLIDFLDNYNALVQLFRTDRNKCADINIPEFKLRLYNVIGTRRYDLPTPETIEAIIFGGIYDAILRGDHNGSDLGTRTILSASFTGGHATYIVDRIFEQKVCDYIKFVRNTKIFGHITAVLYTIEFQKRGLPHCHSLLWLSPSTKVQQDIDVDKYISAELPDPLQDPEAYRVISELMIHGPCGYANKNASCMKDRNKCNRNFPKPYCDATYIDKDGFAHYRRRHTDIDTQRQQVRLDNSYVVPFNRALCMSEGVDRINLSSGGLLTYIQVLETYSISVYFFAIRRAANLSEKYELSMACVSSTIMDKAIFINVRCLLKGDLDLVIGKTFLWKCITSVLRSEERIVLTVASSGIASLLQLADLLRETDLIIWDEAPMNDRRCFEALDRCLRDILDNPQMMFGGKTIILGGDFRQTLLVKKKASKLEIIDASITTSYLWTKFKVYTLHQNMRLSRPDITDDERNKIKRFSSWLLDIGDGNIGDTDTIDGDNSSTVEIPNELTMVEPSETPPKAADKGKLTLFQKEATTLKDIKPADINKTIKVRVYRKWTAINVKTMEAFNFCCILLDKQMLKPVVIAVSSTWATTKYGALQISATPATYYYLNPNIPEFHHILNVYAQFINPTESLETQIQPCCTDEEEKMRNRYCIQSLLNVNHNIIRYCFRIIIDDGTAIATITCFSLEAHTFTPNCNELVNIVQNKDNHCLPDALKALENTTHIFQYRFGQKAKPRRPNFRLDSVFGASPQPLLHLLPPESATSPPQELLEQTSSTITPLPTELDPHQSTKDLPKGLDTSSKPTNKTAKRKLFEDTEGSEKKTKARKLRLAK
uniref:ATP-dependent DNA helicase n=1 Tax=Tanacetum cinerariifolium TaxID=118510 RepID=A0A6L2M7W3_TANCI|nr:DNA helicase [Tanacetum cinerariifolium]